MEQIAYPRATLRRYEFFGIAGHHDSVTALAEYVHGHHLAPTWSVTTVVSRTLDPRVGKYRWSDLKRVFVARLIRDRTHTVFLSYANYIVLVGQMSAVDRKVHSLHGARDFVEILKTSGWRTLSELNLRDFNLPHPVVVAFGQSNVDRHIVFRVVHIVVHVLAAVETANPQVVGRSTGDDERVRLAHSRFPVGLRQIEVHKVQSYLAYVFGNLFDTQ